MKILIARMNHETNTFSPVPTPLAAFGRNGPDWGDDAYRANRGMRTAMAAFLDAAEREGADIVTPVSAAANPERAGRGRRVCGDLRRDRRGGARLRRGDARPAWRDGRRAERGRRATCSRVRAALPNAPIAVALDLHANVTQKMIDHADVIVSFKTYPHVDMVETGEHAARVLLDRLHGRARPVLAAAAAADDVDAAQCERGRRNAARGEGRARRRGRRDACGIGAARLRSRTFPRRASAWWWWPMATAPPPTRWPSASHGRSGTRATTSSIAARRSLNRLRRPRRSRTARIARY